MEDLFARVIKTEDNKSIQVTGLPPGGIQIEGITMGADGIYGNRMAFSNESAKALIKILKEWEEEVL